MAIVTDMKNALMGSYVVSTQVRKESVNLNIRISQAKMKKIFKKLSRTPQNCGQYQKV